MSSYKKDDLDSHITRARLPSLPGLRCFDAAAGLESFSRAADALNLTHGAVSRAVRSLEEELGVALFERRNRRVFLTEQGRLLAAAVRDGFDSIETGIRDLRLAQRTAALVVSCEPTLLMRWLIPRLPGFQELHPDIAVHFVAGGGPISLGQGVDLAIRRNDFAWSPDIHADVLFEERIGPVCRTDKVREFFEIHEAEHPELLAGAPLLHSRTRPSAWETWNSLTDAHGVNHPKQVFDHFYFSLQAATAGLGVAIGPWQLVRDDLDSTILSAPNGFIEDGFAYYLLASARIDPESPQARLRDWLRHVAL